MAAIDRFEFLLREILDVFSNLRDAFALLGALYAARKTFQLSATLFGSLNVHLISRLSVNCDLAEKFGKWAGNKNLCMMKYQRLFQFCFRLHPGLDLGV